MKVDVQLDPAVKNNAKLSYVDGVKVDKQDRTPTLIQNKNGNYTFAPRHLAIQLEKKYKAVILKPSDPDYVSGTKLAVGFYDGFKPGELIQIGGKAVMPEQIGAVDTKSIIEAAEEAAKQSKKGGGIEVVNDLPESLSNFDKKLR